MQAEEQQHHTEAEDASDGDGSLQLQTEEPDFFDPDLDDQDAEALERQRGGRRSDAILSCPGCLDTVCIDCQQHAQVPTQFRAVFAMNCRSVLLFLLNLVLDTANR